MELFKVTSRWMNQSIWKDKNTMTLPGFTAETSLYRTTGQYHTARAQHQIQGMVPPAFVDSGCYNNCYSRCYSEHVNYWGDAQAICTDDCTTQCTCKPVTICQKNGLCTTCTTSCGGDSDSTTTCTPVVIDPYSRLPYNGILKR
jgi:hypothetical protein